MTERELPTAEQQEQLIQVLATLQQTTQEVTDLLIATSSGK
jgi:hypothetical protein